MTIREVKMQARLSEWRSNIQEQKKSGQTICQWCKEHNCGEGQYYYWLKLVRQQVLEQVEADHSTTLVRISPERLPAVVRQHINGSPTLLCVRKHHHSL